MKNSVKNFLKTFGILSVLTLTASVLYARNCKNASMKSSDGKFILNMPQGWKSISGELNPGAVIEIADKTKDAYLVAIPYGKKNFAALKDFHTYFIGIMEKTYQDYKLLHTEKTLVNAQEAYLIKGTLMFEEILYESRVYTIEYADVYLFVMAWTPSQDSDESFPEIEKMIRSLRRVKH